MTDLLSYLLSTAGGATGVLVLGYLCRAQLGHWLNADLEKRKAEFQRELESDKARHQHELEAYRTSLVAEVERIKAQQSARLAGATLIVQRKFQVLEVLTKAVSNHGTNALSTIAFEVPDPERRLALLQQVQLKSQQIAAALDDANPFLELEDSQRVIQLNLAVNSVIGEVLAGMRTGVPFIVGQTRADVICELNAHINVRLRAHIARMMRMD
jgi:hypothetical protein